jgi:phosphatidylinositol-3-phosphatase
MRRKSFSRWTVRIKIAAPALIAIWLAFGAVGSPAAAPARFDGVPAFGHVFLVVGENASFSEITARHAPYITETLRPGGAWLTRYSALADGSLANYAAIVSGQFVRCENNNDFSFTNGDVPGQHACHQNVDNLFHQLDGRGISWQEWTESADNACDLFDHGTTWAHNLFSAHHSPAPYFDDIQAHHSSEDVVPSLECRQKVLPTGTSGPDDMSAFDAALTTGAVARFDMIIPNDCENGHDRCGTHDSVRQFDDFLAREVPKIEASPAFGPDGLIIVVWDEGADPPLAPLHVGAALIGPRVAPGVNDAQRLTHYSMLRTLEDGFGITRHLAHAAKAKPITGIWRP